MNILGISCFYHESAATLIRNGKIIAAAAEERFTRIKHDNNFPTNAIKFCLQTGKITAKNLSYVVFYEKPFIKFERIILTILSEAPFTRSLFVESFLNLILEKLWIKNIITENLKIDKDKVLFVPHHVSHAASAYFVSPFIEAATLTLDGVGEWTTATIGAGEGNKLNIYKEIKFPHSLGLLYSTFTAFLGFEVNDGEYKVMGMAPYGKPKYVETVKKLIKTIDSSFWLDLDYFSYQKSIKKSFNEKFCALFGEPRPKDTHFFTTSTAYPSYFGEKPKNFRGLAAKNQYYADIAASIQKVTEEIILDLARYAHQETKKENLCFAGGVGLNSVANGRLTAETPFNKLFVQPAAGDDGGSLGAAFYVWNHILGKQKNFVLENAYFGKSYREKEIKKFLEQKKIKYDYFGNEEKLIEYIAESINQGLVVGWFQGSFEWGPRALGNRSILADPRREEMKDIVNTKIKFREPYRPFAPVVLEEQAKNYFDIDLEQNEYPARFMLVVAPVLKSKQKEIPAVVHVDGSGRLQTIKKEENPRYYSLIEKFFQKTKVPILLNTSFNLKGEPIVNSPENAYNTFRKSGLDLLVLEKFVIKKMGESEVIKKSKQ